MGWTKFHPFLLVVRVIFFLHKLRFQCKKGNNARTGFQELGVVEGKCIKINEQNSKIYVLGMHYVATSATVANTNVFLM